MRNLYNGESLKAGIFKNVTIFFLADGSVTRLSFETCYREYVCLQYSAFTYLFKGKKHASLCPYRQFTVFMFLHVHTTFNQDLFSAKSCLMSFV